MDITEGLEIGLMALGGNGETIVAEVLRKTSIGERDSTVGIGKSSSNDVGDGEGVDDSDVGMGEGCNGGIVVGEGDGDLKVGGSTKPGEQGGVSHKFVDFPVVLFIA